MVPDKSLINRLLRPWSEKIIDSHLKFHTDDGSSRAAVESEVAERIKRMFFQLANNNPSLRTSEILEIAELALSKGYKLLARKLLQVENPPILKIGFFLKMEDFESALEEAVHCFDSHYIYLIFKKFTGHLKSTKQSNFTLESLSRKIQILGSTSLMNHLLGYLTSDCLESREKVVAAISNPLEFLRLSPVTEYLSATPGLDKLTGNEKRKFFNGRIARAAQVVEDALYKITEGKDRELRSFLEREVKQFFVGIIQAKILDVNLIQLKFGSLKGLSPALVLRHICESSEKFHSARKISNDTLKEFRNGMKISDWEVSLARLKMLLKRKDFETSIALILTMKVNKVTQKIANIQKIYKF